MGSASRKPPAKPPEIAPKEGGANVIEDLRDIKQPGPITPTVFKVVDIFDVLYGNTLPPDQPPPPNISPGDYKNTPREKVVYITDEPEALLKIEDTFWKEKKRVLPDLKAVKVVEDYALKAPLSVKASPEILASYLVKPCKSEIEKVRAIYWWVAHNIKYDVRHLNEGAREDDPPNDVLRSGVASYEGYSGLCYSMLKSVGVEVEQIYGTAKGARYWPGIYELVPDNDYDGAHAWNKVKIDGTWFLVDPTWLAGGTTSDKFSGRQEFKLMWNETYFLAEPEGFLNQHLPLHSNLSPRNPETANVITDQQLVLKPVEDFISWNKTPNMRSVCWHLGIKPINHKEGVIYTSDNFVRIELNSRITTNLWIFLKKRSKDSMTTLQGYSWISNNGKNIEVFARLPENGIYSLEICGHPWRMEKLQNGHNDIWVKIDYTIVAEGRQNNQSFPIHTKTLGLSLPALDAGFRVIEPSDYILTVHKGKAVVVIEMPDEQDLVPLWAKLYKSNKQQNDRNILVERHGKICVIHVICAEIGEYLLDISLPSKENIGRSGASFLIKSKNDNSSTTAYPAGCHTIMGAGELFLINEITLLYPQVSTLYAKEGSATIIAKFNHPVQTFYILTDTNGNRYNYCVKENMMEDIMGYDIKLTRSGIYNFVIYITLEGKHGKKGASFLIVVPEQLGH